MGSRSRGDQEAECGAREMGTKATIWLAVPKGVVWTAGRLASSPAQWRGRKPRHQASKQTYAGSQIEHRVVG